MSTAFKKYFEDGNQCKIKDELFLLHWCYIRGIIITEAVLTAVFMNIVIIRKTAVLRA